MTTKKRFLKQQHPFNKDTVSTDTCQLLLYWAPELQVINLGRPTKSINYTQRMCVFLACILYLQPKEMHNNKLTTVFTSVFVSFAVFI